MKGLIILGLLLVYGWGFWKVWTGFYRTTFAHTFINRLSMSLLWPVLFIANKSYRRNFTRALKGN